MEEKTFVFGTAAAGENFTDRVKETKRLTANFTHGINTILISPRRWGKTSLVKHVINTIQEPDIKVVYIDIFSCRNLEEFYSRFAEEVIKQTSSKYDELIENIKSFLQRFNPKFKMSSGSAIELSLSLDITPKADDEWEILEIPEKIAVKKKCRVVVCIDEFQQIGEFPDSLNFQKRLRTVWQHQHHTSYCLFGSKKHLMTELFAESSKPFYKFGDIIFLNKIPASDWIPYILSRFKNSGKEISEELAADICFKIENQSNYVQQLSWILWVNTDKEATREALEESFDELINHNSLLFERMTENLTAPQLNFLRAITEGVHNGFSQKDILAKYQLGTASNIKRLKESLLQKDLIDIESGEVTIPDPVFRHWLIRSVF